MVCMDVLEAANIDFVSTLRASPNFFPNCRVFVHCYCIFRFVNFLWIFLSVLWLVFGVVFFSLSPPGFKFIYLFCWAIDCLRHEYVRNDKHTNRWWWWWWWNLPASNWTSVTFLIQKQEQHIFVSVVCEFITDHSEIQNRCIPKCSECFVGQLVQGRHKRQTHNDILSK